MYVDIYDCIRPHPVKAFFPPLLLLLQSTLRAASERLVRVRVGKSHWQCLPTLPPLLLLSTSPPASKPASVPRASLTWPCRPLARSSRPHLATSSLTLLRLNPFPVITSQLSSPQYCNVFFNGCGCILITDNISLKRSTKPQNHQSTINY